MRLISLLLVLLLFSCKKDDLEEVVVSSSLSDGVVVLCEGLFQQNNSTLSWINNSDGSVSNTLFSTKVGRQLGDTGNDINDETIEEIWCNNCQTWHAPNEESRTPNIR